ncbi:MAG: peptide ABC transporter substrate-binding protein [Candidatus Eremiobacteraeota bacterium]|nr:peptide ABC transporter substrate-binding protein [Candidatus Eremiobacteraeota bacterium]
MIRFGCASALIALLFAGACTKQSTTVHSGRNPWTVPGVLRLGEDEEPDSLNLMFGHNAATDTATALIYSFLLRYDDKGNYIPDLATAVPTIANGGISPDGKRIVVHLRRGIVWSDGAPLTAADWLFTYRAVMSPENNVKTRYGWDLIASASAPDPFTLVIRLKRPSVEVFGDLAMGGAAYPPMPAHLLAKLPNLNSAEVNGHPLSSGPFVLQTWNHGASLTFVPNRRYFRGAPKLKKLIWKFVPDVNTLFNELQTHEVDVYPSVDPNSVSRLSAVVGITVDRRLVAKWRHLGMNLSRPQLADVRVRRAITEAIDFKRIVRTIYHGLDEMAVSDIFPRSWAAPSLPPYGYDPSDARRLLAEAGWKMGSDGVLHKGALRMELSVYATTGHEENTQSQVMIQSMLRPLGIEIAVRNYPGSYLFAMNGPLYQGKYDLEWSVETNAPDPDNSGSWNGAFIPPGGANTSWLNDPIVNAASAAAAATFDQSRRKLLYQREEERLRELLPAAIVSWQTSVTAMNSDLRGYVPAAYLADSWNAWQWSI